MIFNVNLKMQNQEPVVHRMRFNDFEHAKAWSAAQLTPWTDPDTGEVHRPVERCDVDPVPVSEEV